VTGLIAWRRPLAAGLPATMPAWLRDGLATGIAASALTTPIAALHFGTASWIGVLATIVAAPVLAAAVALLFASLLMSAFTGASAGPFAVAADAVLRLLDAIAATAAAVPGGHGHLATPTVLYGLLGIAGAVIARAWLRGEGPAQHQGRGAARTRFLRAGVGAAVVAVIASWAPLLLPGPRTLEIHAIDVGQGDALAVRTPGGRWLLVDTGPRGARFDAGRDRVVPYLLRRGVRRIDVLVLTHPDADHIGGAEAVLEAFDTGVVIDPGFPAGKDMFIDLLAAARGAGGRWVAARAGQSFLMDGVEITMLYPATSFDGAPDANDNSVVFRLAYGDFAALFTGDAPTAVEDAIVAHDPAALRAQLLKVGHHGSRTSTGEQLLLAARPELAFISAGRNNRYGHPNPRVLRRLESHGVRVLRTDQLGSIIVRAGRDGRVDVLAR
jgi:competence protein ComEC